MFLRNFLLIFVFIYGICSQSCPQTPTTVGDTVTFDTLEGDLTESTLNTKYESKGLQGFFNLAKSFMNTVQPKSLSKEFAGEVKNFDLNNNEFKKKLYTYETPIAIAVGFGVLFMLLMPIVGFCFCCFRCCGKCGGKKYQHPKEAEKHSKCFIMSIILFVITVFMLCGVLFMFVTNNRTHDTAKNLGTTYEKVIDNVVNIAKSTSAVAKQISDNLLPCLIALIEEQIGQNGLKNHIGTPLKNFVNDGVMGTLNNATIMATTVDNMKTKLDGIKVFSDKLKGLGTDLENGVTGIQTNLDEARVLCGGVSDCETKIDDFKNKVTVTIKFNDLPKIEDSINKIKEVQDLDLAKEIATGKKLINDIPETTWTKAKSAVTEIKKVLTDLEKKIKDQVNNVTDNIDETIVNKKADFMKYKTDYLDPKSDFFKYENYRWYAYYGLSGLMAFIVVLMALGLVLGVCGYSKEDLPSNRSGTATCGGNCLMAAVGFMFIFSFFLMLFCVIWYVVGIHLHLVCRDLKDATIIDSFLDDSLKINGKVISAEEILKSCRKNDPLYRSIGGELVFNISAKFNFRDLTDDIYKKLNDLKIDLGDQNILTADITNALNKVTNSNDIDYKKFFDTLKAAITKSNLNEVATNVSVAAADIKPVKPAVATKLDEIAVKLNAIGDTTVKYITSNISVLEKEVNDMKVLSANIKNQAIQLLDDFNKAETFIKTGTTLKIGQLVTNLAGRIIGFLIQATEFLVNQATGNLLRCKPIADLYDGLINTLVCDDVVQNANGFWLALGWCLLFFVVAIIFCVKLAKFYRKMDYDSGVDQFENPPYNDKIPLQTIRTDESGSPSNGRYDSTIQDHNLLLTDYNRVPMQDELLDYDHNPPPPYQQHNNKGYNNQ